MEGAVQRRLAKRHFPIRVIAAVLLVAAASIGWVAWHDRSRPLPQPSTAAPRDYRTALADVDAQIVGVGGLVKARPDEWLMQERFANAWLRRARLTGSYADYAQAQAALDRAFASAPSGAGPHMTQAVTHFTLHRLTGAETMLAAIERYAVPAERETQDAVAAMRSDIAFYQGHYRLAERQVASEPGFRSALYLSRTGEPDVALDRADAAERAIRFPSAQTLAQFALLRATIALQRGDWEGATSAFERGDQVFPGYWLMEAGRAQMQAVAGDGPGAAARLESIAARSNAPEVMDLLAAIYRSIGDRQQSTVWAARASAIWNRRLAIFPEAGWQHAAEHELAFGSPARAFDLAQRDWRNRPYGQAATTLAWAAIATGRPAFALRVLAPLEPAGWVSAEQYAAASQAELLLGHPDRSDAARAKSIAINPKAFDPLAAMLWIGH